MVYEERFMFASSDYFNIRSQEILRQSLKEITLFSWTLANNTLILILDDFISLYVTFSFKKTNNYMIYY